MLHHGRLLLLSSLTVASLLILWLTLTWTQAPTFATNNTSAPPGLDRSNAYFPPTPDLCKADKALNTTSICATFPTHLLTDIQIVLKTGIGERPQLSSLLATHASCIPNLLIVSDAPDTVHAQPVHDIIADLPASYAVNNTDWAAYTEQRRLHAEGRPVGKNHGGWRLDRFKFLPMVEYAYTRRPNARWYVFIETDVYVFWDSLFRVLERLDPDERHYLGAAVPGAWDRWFGYGGAGFVLSHGLLRGLTLEREDRLSVKYEAMVREDCCGDAVLAYVLYGELGVRVGSMFPSFSGMEPQWAAVWPERWCTPLVTLHRVTPGQMESLWRWERCRAVTEGPITFASLLDWGLAPILVDGRSRRKDWDNGADGNMAHLRGISADLCFAVCERSPTCLQASHRGWECRLSERILPGAAVDAGEKMESFWDVKKLEQRGWRSEEGMCVETTWLEPEVWLPPMDLWQWLGVRPWPEPVPEGSH